MIPCINRIGRGLFSNKMIAFVSLYCAMFRQVVLWSPETIQGYSYCALLKPYHCTVISYGVNCIVLS